MEHCRDKKAFGLTLSKDENYVLLNIRFPNIKEITLGVVKDDGCRYNDARDVMFEGELKVGDIVWLEFWEADKVNEYETEPDVWLPLFGKPTLNGVEKVEVTSLGLCYNEMDLFFYERIELKKVKQ